jgi:hypothetical protein
LLQAPPEFRQQPPRLNARLLRQFIHQPEHGSRLILDLDSPVVTVFGRLEGAEVGYNPRFQGKRSYDPLLFLEANSSFLWDTELRPDDAGTWAGSEGLSASCFFCIPNDIREVRLRADAGFGFHPVLALGTQKNVSTSLSPAWRSVMEFTCNAAAQEQVRAINCQTRAMDQNAGSQLCRNRNRRRTKSQENRNDYGPNRAKQAINRIAAYGNQ